MITITDKASGKMLGTITDEQLQILIDELEEESIDDQDYYINRALIEAFEEKGIDADLVAFLKKAIGDKDDVEIVWQK